MSQKTIQGSQEFAKKIKLRRNELNLTIEEAAKRAGVGTKTWSRYEAGGSIRRDKYKGVCKALNWHDFSEYEGSNTKRSFSEEFKNHEAWSQFLADNYGDIAAASFAAGSEILLDYIQEDLSDLASMPAGSHIGQLDTSFIFDDLPSQFLMQYDYDFLYQMKCTLVQLRRKTKRSVPMVACSVMEELIIYLCNEAARLLIELSDYTEFDYSDDWIFDMFGDSDVISYLYSDVYIRENDHPYHFIHWNVQQFCTN